MIRLRFFAIVLGFALPAVVHAEDAPPSPPAPADAATAPAQPTDPDPIREKLDAAKAAYAAEQQAWRAAALAWFDERETRARDDGDKKRFDQVREDREAFEDIGSLPKAFPSATIRRLTKAQTRMYEAYNEAISAYTKARQDDRAAVVEAESHAFLLAVSESEARLNARAELGANLDAPSAQLPGGHARLFATLAGSKWPWGGGLLILAADGSGTATGSPTDAPHHPTWAVISPTEIILRWPSNDFDILTFAPGLHSYTKDWLGRPAGRPQDRVTGERIP